MAGNFTSLTISTEVRKNFKKLIDLKQKHETFKVTQSALLQTLIDAELERMEKMEE